jgi:D-alanyl-D-alanine dipeptidase
MAAKGFVNYDQEWWHFTFQPEPYPTVYFDFPITED